MPSCLSNRDPWNASRMPIVVSLMLAVLIAGVVFGAAALKGRTTDAADVRAENVAVRTGQALKHSAFKRFVLQRRDPAKETGLLLTIAVGGIALAVILIGVVLEMVSKHVGYARLDDSAARFGADHATPGTTHLLKFVTNFGSTPYVIAVAAIVGTQQFIQHRRKAIPLFLATVVASTILIGNLVKLIVNRDRPNVARLISASGSSFPSGHSAASAATYAAVALLLGRGHGRRVQAILAGAAASIALAVATTRVLLGVHWLTDVTAGLLLGWSCFATCSIAFGGRVMRFGKPVEQAQAAAAVPPGQSPSKLIRTP